VGDEKEEGMRGGIGWAVQNAAAHTIIYHRNP